MKNELEPDYMTYITNQILKYKFSISCRYLIIEDIMKSNKKGNADFKLPNK